MSTDTNVSQLIINRLSNEQYETAVKNDTELYLTPEEPASTTNLGPVKVDGTSITATADGTISATQQLTVDTALSDTSTNPVQNKVIKEALDTKQNTITGAASTVVSDNLAVSRAAISNASGKLDVSDTTSTELEYVHGVTSNIQTQLNNKINSSARGAANGVASLDSNTKVPIAQIPYSTSTSLGTSNTVVPTQNAVKAYTDGKFIPQSLVNTGSISNGVGRRETRYGGMNTDTTFRGITITQVPCNVLYRANLKGATITCNYEDKVANLGKRFVDGDFGSYYTSINPSTMFGDKPFVWEITRPTAFASSDVTKLLICGHNIVWNATTATNYKLEVATYANGVYTWGTAYEYSGTTAVSINGYYRLYSSTLSETTVVSIYGIRLTINSSPDTIFNISEILLYDDRGSYSLAHSLNSVDVGRDTTVYANITIPTDNGSFIGNLTGIASKATNDVDGNPIKTTYLKVADKPVVNNATLTIQKNSTNVATFTANASSNVTANIEVPTITDTYSATSSDGMSGKAVASAISSKHVNGAQLSRVAIYFYGTSDTAGATAEKEVSIPSITTLLAGTIIVVTPSVTSTVANSTIKLNNFTAYPMRYKGSAITTSTDSIVWPAHVPTIWVFDGDYWHFAGRGADDNTTYSNMSVSEGTTGTATTQRTVRADYLKQIIQGTILTGLDTTSATVIDDTDTVLSGLGKLQAQVNNKADSATTLAGYGITNAYTKTEIDGMVSAGMHYKGTVATVADLPASNNHVGDLYNVTATGANYAWDGTAWDKLSENIDLSGLALKTEAAGSLSVNDATLTLKNVNGGTLSTVTVNNVSNATNATKATQDGSGNVITSTYLPFTGGTLTGNLIVGSTDTNKNVSVNGQLIVRKDTTNIQLYSPSTEKLVYLQPVNDNTKGSRLGIVAGGHAYNVLDDTDKAVANGVATLDANTKIPVTQIPDLSSTYSTVANTVTAVAAGSTANKIDVTKNGTTSTITVNNVANATEASKVYTQAGTSDSDRVVFFAHTSDTKQVVYDTDFKYNPSTNKLTVENVNSNKVSVGGSEQATMQYNATTQSIDFVFA